MVSVEMKEQIQVLEPTPEKLNPTAARQVTDIIEESEQAQNSRQAEKAYWSYRMPFAGVRYYSY